MWPRFRPFASLLCALTACQGPQADTSPFTTMPPASAGSTANSDVSTSGGASGSGGTEQGSTTGDVSTISTGAVDGSTTLILDVGSVVDAGDGKPAGCHGKIDFLFVISRYGGMAGVQKQLRDAFPKFIDTIESKFPNFDYHIMVVDGDDYWGSKGCDAKCPVLCAPGYPCGYKPAFCDAGLGVGVVFPAGMEAANKVCPIDGGRNYMVTGQTDLKATFSCVAQLGLNGAARIGEVTSIVVQPWMNDRGSCNEGFLRKDALLMVTLVSNTYDEVGGIVTSQEGTPETWRDAVRDAKHGDLESVVALGIIPNEGPGCAKKDRLCQFLELFPYSLNADLWADDYAAAFDQATDLVEEACAGFVPPG